MPCDYERKNRRRGRVLVGYRAENKRLAELFTLEAGEPDYRISKEIHEDICQGKASLIFSENAESKTENNKNVPILC